MSDNRRTQTRHEVELPATIQLAGESHEVIIRNLSLGGAFIAFDQRVAMGTRIEVRFRIPTQESAIDVGGQVRWSAESGLGVQFDGFRARDVWSLNKYFESLSS